MSAATGPQPLGELLPAWSVAPFALMLLAIAVLPLAAPHSWERNRNKLLVSVVLGGPVVAGIALIDPGAVLHTAHEYAAFVILLGALFVISGGVVVRGTLAGTPGLNTVLLAIGAVWRRPSAPPAPRWCSSARCSGPTRSARAARTWWSSSSSW